MHRYTPIHAREARKQGQRIRRYDRRSLKRQFLMYYAAHPNTTQACLHVGVSRSGFYRWLKTDTRFNEKYHAILAAYYDIWLHSEPEEWRAHLKKRNQGHRLIRYYLRHDVQVRGTARTMQDVLREQYIHERLYGPWSE